MRGGDRSAALFLAICDLANWEKFRFVEARRGPPPLRARSALEGEVSLSACAKETEGVTVPQKDPAP